jgi:hypothetical protein
VRVGDGLDFPSRDQNEQKITLLSSNLLSECSCKKEIKRKMFMEKETRRKYSCLKKENKKVHEKSKQEVKKINR